MEKKRRLLIIGNTSPGIGWAGSYRDDDLLNKLGTLIEDYLNEESTNEKPEPLVN
jgi:hypothetical protein